MATRSARRREQLNLAHSLRQQGQSWRDIAITLRAEYGLNPRVAMRLAHGWGQADAAQAWNERWPDEPKTFKNFSYWENWPSRTGYAPSPAVLDRLARLYECDAADLLADWGVHHAAGSPKPEPRAPSPLEPATLAWLVGHLELPELTHAIADWSRQLSPEDRRALLFKLSTAAALSASELPDQPTRITSPSPLSDLAGVWESRYTYTSAGRNAEFTSEHQIELRVESDRLTGTSKSDPSGSELELALSLAGSVATGTWTERTSPTGYYRAATYRGVVQFVVDPSGRTMFGQWLGVGKRFTVNAGRWALTWAGPADRSPAR